MKDEDVIRVAWVLRIAVGKSVSGAADWKYWHFVDYWDLGIGTAGILLTSLTHYSVIEGNCLLWWYLQTILVFIRSTKVIVWKKSSFQALSAFFGCFSFLLTEFTLQEINWSSESLGSIKTYFVSRGLKYDSMMYLLLCILFLTENPPEERGREYGWNISDIDAFQTCSGK